ncbi:MAG: transcriptional regulator GutM [Anaerolineales bacterium]|nr:transcriptional regulator GutM [Anaerolineales bacterium]
MDIITNNFGLIFLILGALWLIQFGLAYWQMRRFYQRMITLRQSGLTAIGLSGNRYQGRAYAVLTIDEDDRIIHAEQFSGWTVFAQLRPMPQLIGMPLQELLNNEANLPISKKLRSACANAARDLQAARGKGEINTLSQANLGIV